ncbi:MAG: EamA family transporter [Candidatus Aenigmatarchaeota archaeon]
MSYTWLIFAILSALTASLVAIFGKIGLENIDANVATMVRAGIMFAFLILFTIFNGKLNEVSSIFSNSKSITYIFLSGIAGALSWLFYFFALKLGKVSQVVPIDRLSIVFAIILAFFILGEKISLKVTVGSALIVAGAIIIAL